MRIPDWTPALKPQPQDLVDATLARRGGTLLNLDKALLWSEPIARGWNIFMRDVRFNLPTSRRLTAIAAYNMVARILVALDIQPETPRHP